jgi:hypothetical protein
LFRSQTNKKKELTFIKPAKSATFNNTRYRKRKIVEKSLQKQQQID